MNNNYNQQPPFQNGPGYGPQPPYSNGPGNNRPTLDFVNAIKICFTKYVDFNGRASRAEFWWWYLFTFLVGAAFSQIGPLANLLSVALLLPSLAVQVRRLHDIGKGGGWIFFFLIPLVGWIFFFVWNCEEGERHPNRFGYNPYGINDGFPPKPY